jgi:hypothetical protein
MDEARLREIEAREAKATPGPWEATPEHDNGTPHIWGNHEAIMLERHGQGMVDAEFIACAREDVPDLVVEVRRLGRFLDDLYLAGFEPSFGRVDMMDRIAKVRRDPAVGMAASSDGGDGRL